MPNPKSKIVHLKNSPHSKTVLVDKGRKKGKCSNPVLFFEACGQRLMINRFQLFSMADRLCDLLN